MTSNDWHGSEDLLQAVLQFHESYARQPQEQIAEVNARHSAIMGEIKKKMRQRGIPVRFEYTGSTCEGTSVTKCPCEGTKVTKRTCEGTNVVKCPCEGTSVIKSSCEGANVVKCPCKGTKVANSPCEGTVVAKIPEDNYDLDFDLMLIVDCRGTVLQVERMRWTRDNYARLKIPGALASPAPNIPFSCLDDNFDDTYLIVRETAEKFFDELQKCINESQNLGGAVALRRNGPTTQMDVFGVGNTDVLYSVNVLPTYEVVGERYVAMDLIERDNYAWRRSFSIEEKEILLGADGDNGYRKKVLRILKAIRNREPGLELLTSYHLKTALFLEMKEVRSRWLEDDLGRRLMGVIGQLEKCLTVGNLPHNFLGNKVNLLSTIPPEDIENMRDRFRDLLSSEMEMKRILSAQATTD